MYDCKAPLSRFYYPETRRIINAFIIIIIITSDIPTEYTHCHNHQTTARTFERSVGHKFGCAPAIFLVEMTTENVAFVCTDRYIRC